MIPLRALLFDLDGTLVDTPQAIVEVTQATLAEMDLPPADAQAIKDGIGLPLPLALGQLIGGGAGFAGDGRSPKGRSIGGPLGAAEAVEIYRRLWRAQVTPRIPQLLYPGVAAGLAELKSRGLRLAVVTGKAQDGADSTVDAAGLRPYLDVVLGYTSVANPKPAPDIALAALERLRIPPPEAAVVGDASHDLMMARAAGVRSIAVTYGAQPEAALRAENPTFVAHDFAEVVRIALALATLQPP
jgi:phosphoglycolate phosphatase